MGITGVLSVCVWCACTSVGRAVLSSIILLGVDKSAVVGKDLDVVNVDGMVVVNIVDGNASSMLCVALALMVLFTIGVAQFEE